MNSHDSERIAGLLKKDGYTATEIIKDADLVVINTCSVREKAEEKLFTKLSEVRNQTCDKEPLIAVIGCVAQQEGEKILKRSTAVDIVVGTQALKRLPRLIEKAAIARETQIDIKPYDDVSFPLGIAARSNPVKAYITIIEGCNDFCSFCVVPYTRGHERMRRSAEILEEVRHATETGHNEIHLLGQIVNHYRDPDLPDYGFPKLLEQINAVPAVKRIRFASPHPRHVSAQMIEAVRDLPKVCKHLHLPVQSGSSRVLKAMRRRYSRENYLDLICEIRTSIPEIAFSTDAIVGFPGETEEDFEQTLSLVRSVGFHSMFSFKYSERPNTLAKRRMPDNVPEKEKSTRLSALQSLQRRIQTELNIANVGKTFEVLVDSRSRRREHEMSGRTTQNTIVNFPGKTGWIGSAVNVDIDSAGPNSLHGTASNHL